MKTIHPVVHDAILDLRKDTAALKHLSDLEELTKVPPECGGVYFSDWEISFIKFMGEQQPVFTDAQREKLKEIWQAVDLRKRAAPDQKTENLFSKLSPERQAEQRERAAKVKFPWER